MLSVVMIQPTNHMKPLRWTQIDDDYKLGCPCCGQNIAVINKVDGRYYGQAMLNNKITKVEEGKTFKSVRAAVNKRIEELLNHS